MNSMPIYSYPSVRSIIVTKLLKGNLNNILQVMDEIIEENDSSVLRELNSILSRPEYLSMLIQLVRNNPEFLEKMQRESYYHENGFHKIVLLEGKNFKLRIHQFGSSAKIPMENIHDHRWPFASSILYGQLKMDLFELAEDYLNAEKLYHFIYNSNKQGGSYSTSLKGVTYLKKIQTRNYSCGDNYLMLPQELHRIKNQPGDESITLILTGKPQGVLCNLYAKRKILEQEKIQKQYSQELLWKMLDQIIEFIYPQKN